MKRPWSYDDTVALTALLAEGRTLTYAGRILNRTHKTIRLKMERYGLRSQVQPKKAAQRKPRMPSAPVNPPAKAHPALREPGFIAPPSLARLMAGR